MGNLTKMLAVRLKLESLIADREKAEPENRAKISEEISRTQRFYRGYFPHYKTPQHLNSQRTYR
jgi:uncharacterized protein YbcC (UPF0753/DUF2309 family)